MFRGRDGSLSPVLQLDLLPKSGAFLPGLRGFSLLGLSLTSHFREPGHHLSKHLRLGGPALGLTQAMLQRPIGHFAHSSGRRDRSKLVV